MEFLELGQFPNFLRQRDQVVIPQAELNISKQAVVKTISHKEVLNRNSHTLPCPFFFYGSILSIYLQVTMAKQETVPGVVVHSRKTNLTPTQIDLILLLQGLQK